MAKLYYRYGTVGSAKTLNLLAVAHNYRNQGKRVVVVVPEIDTRFGVGTVRSRAGLEMDADVVVRPGTLPTTGRDQLETDRKWLDGVACVLVDEAQFLDPVQIDDLRDVTVDPGVPVICYGLRTDYRGDLFPGSRRLMEVADSIEEVKTTCFRMSCDRKAVANLMIADGRPVFEGESIVLGDECYKPVCWTHFREARRSHHPDRSAPSGVAEFFGTWPGDETENELLAALDAID